MKRRSTGSKGAMFRKLPVQPKKFKEEGRQILRKRKELLSGGFYYLPETLELRKVQAGCVGQVNRGTIIKFNTTRSTAVGKLFFFDGFMQTPEKDLQWIGEFDTMLVDEVAAACGHRMRDDEYRKVLIPDDAGVLREMVGDAVVVEGKGDIRAST